MVKTSTNFFFARSSLEHLMHEFIRLGLDNLVTKFDNEMRLWGWVKGKCRKFVYGTDQLCLLNICTEHNCFNYYCHFKVSHQFSYHPPEPPHHSFNKSNLPSLITQFKCKFCTVNFHQRLFRFDAVQPIFFLVQFSVRGWMSAYACVWLWWKLKNIILNWL